MRQATSSRSESSVKRFSLSHSSKGCFCCSARDSNDLMARSNSSDGAPAPSRVSRARINCAGDELLQGRLGQGRPRFGRDLPLLQRLLKESLDLQGRDGPAIHACGNFREVAAEPRTCAAASATISVQIASVASFSNESGSMLCNV